jgi:hypothetical protein
MPGNPKLTYTQAALLALQDAVSELAELRVLAGDPAAFRATAAVVGSSAAQAYAMLALVEQVTLIAKAV